MLMRWKNESRASKDWMGTSAPRNRTKKRRLRSKMCMDVFVISEDPDMLDWTKEVLDSREERLKVVTASTPEGALRLLGDGDFDMIISDHKMLKDNGSALLKVISEKMEKMEEPLIILLDKDQEGMVVKTLSPGELNGDHEEVLHSLLT
ncbi:MAG: response regulator, partial [Candidatus Natronoplasma sp.]